MAKNILKNILVFLITLIICMGALLLVCQIPQSAIHEKSTEASEYFTSHDKYPEVIDGFESTYIDNYADCMLLDVIYNVDEDNTFYSMIEAPYYRIEGNPADEDYASAVIDGKAPNNEYSRYWHGSQVFVRPLLTMMSITGVRLAMFCIFAALNVWLAALLIKRRLIAPAVIYFASLLIVGGWMTAFSLSYVMPFIVMTASCIALCMVMNRCAGEENLANRDKHLTYIFVVSGAVTCFLDFLTAETLSFTIPFLLFMLICRHKQNQDAAYDGSLSFKEDLKRMIKWGVAWLASYAAMFAVKWGLVYLIVGKSAFVNALESAAFRIDGEAGVNLADPGAAITDSMRITVALVRNLSCLFPVKQDLTIGCIFGVSICVLIVLAIILYLFRGERVDGGFIGILLIIACLPYLRYIVLSNHASMHFFFTYRAQMACIMALIGIMAYQLKPSYILSQGKKTSKKTADKDYAGGSDKGKHKGSSKNSGKSSKKRKR